MNNKIIALAIAFLLVTSAIRAEIFDTGSDVVTLPAFVVEATRIDAPSAGLPLSFEGTVNAATTFAERSSERALSRLKDRLSNGGRHYARSHTGRSRSRA